jgi:hypothetical protein
MAASGFTPISLYHTTTPAAVPTAGNLVPGELGLNIADMKLYCENASGVVTLLADAAAQGTVTSVDVSGGTTGLTTSGGPITGSGTITIAGILVASNGGTGNAFFSVSGPATSVKTYTFPNENMSVGYRNIPAVADKTAAYTLTTAEIGKVVGVGSGGSIEIPDSVFAAGDAVLIFNNTAGDITITCTITTAYIAGADADVASVTLATRGVCNILFLSGTACVLTGNIS